MKLDFRRVWHGRAAFMVLTVAGAVSSSGTGIAAEPSFSVPAPPEPEPRCRRDEDLACTLVRETPAGVWVWTERFRAGEAGSTGWTLAIGAGPVSTQPTVQFVAASPPPGPATPNGAPILE